MRQRFKNTMMQGLYEACRKAAADNWSEMFIAHNKEQFGPRAPHRGASHRCAYWDGRTGVSSFYGKDRTILGYAAYRAGADDRKEALRRVPSGTAKAPREKPLTSARRVGTLTNYFGNSEAARVLSEMINKSEDAKLVSKIGRHFNQYTAGLNDIMPCQNDTQAILFEMWFERFEKSAKEIFGKTFKEHNIPMSFYRNVLRAKVAKSKELGGIWQKM